MDLFSVAMTDDEKRLGFEVLKIETEDSDHAGKSKRVPCTGKYVSTHVRILKVQISEGKTGYAIEGFGTVAGDRRKSGRWQVIAGYHFDPDLAIELARGVEHALGEAFVFEDPK